MKRLAIATLLVLAMSSMTAARVIVNEVMANEPGSSTSLEWIELFNDGGSAINLGFYTVEIGATSITLNGTLGAGQYLIIAADSNAFKVYWPPVGLPTYRLMQAGFSLINTGGTVTAKQVTTVESQLSWTFAGLDGYSWERTQPVSDVIRQSVDFTHATPGFINSVTPLPLDLSLDIIRARYDGIGTVVSYNITNRSYVTVTDATVSLYYQAPGSTTADSLISIEALAPIDTGYSSLLEVRYELPGMYATIMGRLSPDDRGRNDTALAIAPGVEFPPLRFSELLPNPQNGLTSEWLEIRNVSIDSVDVSGWWIFDAVDIYRISSGTLKIASQQYLVLAEDSSAFRSYYPDFAGNLLQPPGWAHLNDQVDVIKMRDSFNLVGDTVAYSVAYDENFTLSRRDTPGGTGEWAMSDSSGGTPGRTNTTRAAPKNDRIGVWVEPRVFSPDGDGIDEEAVITLNATPASGYTLEIYDREGRKVRTLEDNVSTLREDYPWDGRDDGGARLPIGIYIVYFNSVGVESVKTTVVIAR